MTTDLRAAAERTLMDRPHDDPSGCIWIAVLLVAGVICAVFADQYERQRIREETIKAIEQTKGKR